MGIAGHDVSQVGPCQPGKPMTDAVQQIDKKVALIAQVELQIQCYLIVSASGRVQLGSGGTDPVGKRFFDIHMNIFELLQKLEFAVVDFFFYRRKPVDNCL